MSGEDAPAHYHHPRVRFVNAGSANMSAKRNLGVAASTAPYVAFTDSDAYPAPGWLDGAITELEAHPDIVMVGGPELPPAGEPAAERYVGLASRSALVTGAHAFRKARSPRRFFSEMSSCNLVMRRRDYVDAGGMNESLYIGEDNEFCQRIGRAGGKLLFSPEVVVHHKNRSLWPFLVQRYARGMASAIVIRRFLRDTLAGQRAASPFRWELLVAPAFIVFISSAILISWFTPWAWLYAAVWALFLGVIALETVKHSERASDYPGLFVTLVCGTIVSGIGAFLSLLGIEPDIKRYYRNRNDAAPAAAGAAPGQPA